MPANAIASAVIRAEPFIFVFFSFRQQAIGCVPGISTAVGHTREAPKPGGKRLLSSPAQ
jgi:hypothetical protein